jgi:hypothetical protein
LELSVWVSIINVWGLEFRILGLGLRFRVKRGSEFRVLGLRFRI